MLTVGKLARARQLHKLVRGLSSLGNQANPIAPSFGDIDNQEKQKTCRACPYTFDKLPFSSASESKDAESGWGRQAVCAARSHGGVEHSSCSLLDVCGSIGEAKEGSVARIIIESPEPAEDLEQLLVSIRGASVEEILEAAAAAVSVSFADERFLGALAHEAIEKLRLSALDPEQMMSISLSFAYLNFFSIDFKNAISKQIISRMKEIDGHVLAKILRSFGMVDYYDAALLNAVAKHVRANVKAYDAADIADISFVFSRFGIFNADLAAAVSEALPELAKEHNLKAMASIVEAYALLSQDYSENEEEVVDSVVDYIAGHIPDLDKGSLVKLIVGLAKLHYDDATLFSGFAKEVIKFLPSMAPKDVVRVVGAFSDMGYPERALLDAVVDDCIATRLNEFSPQAMLSIVTSCNKLDYYSTKLSAEVTEKAEAARAAAA